MFTGLVRHRAALLSCDSLGRDGALLLQLERPKPWSDLRLGDSVAVNGCCLTVISVSEQDMQFEAGSETLARTLFSHLKAGVCLHVEQALRAGDRLDGHIVTGHVDGLAKVENLIDVSGGRRIQFAVADALAAMLPQKGSVCVDGISLTIAADLPCGFVVELIPETLKRTQLSVLCPGDSVHVEVDPLARYAAHWLKRTGA
jgi:riboflavin synthase